jgi:hypothetical protein
MNDMLLETKPNKLIPVLIGGFSMAAVSVIPIVNMINCLCCAGIMGGAIVGVWFYKKNFPPNAIFTTGHGAGIGALSGVVGGVLTSAFTALTLGVFSAQFSVTFQETIDEAFQQMHMINDPNAVEQARQALNALATQPFFTFALVLIASLFIFVAFGTLGGVIGGSIFKTRLIQDYPPPAPPPVS